MATASDSFDGTGSLSGNWTQIFGDVDRVSDVAQNTSGEFGAVRYDGTTFTATQYSEITLGSTFVSACAPWVRMTGADESTIAGYSLFIAPSTSIEVYRKLTGSGFTLLGDRTVSALSAGDRIAISVSGSTIKVWVNGEQQGASFTDALIDGGQPGFDVSAAGEVDAWEGGDGEPSVPDDPEFPTVESTDDSQVASDNTSHAVDLPATIVAGNLLLVFFSCDATAADLTVTPPGGWTQVSGAARGGPAVRVLQDRDGL